MKYYISIFIMVISFLFFKMTDHSIVINQVFFDFETDSKNEIVLYDYEDNIILSLSKENIKENIETKLNQSKINKYDLIIEVSEEELLTIKIKTKYAKKIKQYNFTKNEGGIDNEK